jgi:hypothetical protein
MMKLIAAFCGLAVTGVAYACTTNTIISGGKMETCTTCCYGGSCTTTCI